MFLQGSHMKRCFTLSLTLCVFPILTTLLAVQVARAEIYKCDKTYQNKPCSVKQGDSAGEEVSLPRLNSYSSAYEEPLAEQEEVARYSLKEGAIEQTRHTEDKPQIRSQEDKPWPQVSASQKLSALEQRATFLKKNASNIQKEDGNQNLYGRARALLVETHVLCTADFEKENISLANRCKDLRKKIAEVSKYATTSRTLAR